jgi:hypothetical protein
MRSRVTGTFIFSSTMKMNNGLLNTAVNGWSLSGAYTAQSGNPLTGFMSNSPGSGLGVGDPLNTAGVSGDGGLTGAELSLFNSGTGGRVPQVKRNTFAGPGVHNLDARISRDFTIREGLKVEVLAEAFNLANHQNILSVNTNLSSYLTPAQCGHANGCIAPYTGVPFGSASSTNSTLFGPRQTQFTAKFLF